MTAGYNRYVIYLYYILLVAAVPLFIISSCTTAFAGSVGLYESCFDRYDISAETGISKIDLEVIAANMAGYLSGKMQSPQAIVDIHGMRRPVYNAKELTHLDDVAGITKLFQILLLVSAVAGLAVGLLLYARRELNVLLNACISGSAITITLTGCLVIWSLIDFNSLFYLFHIVSFSNELWLLDPSRDYLIMMFPQGFFFESAIWLVSSIIGLAILVLLACLALKKLLKPTDELGASV